MTANTVPTILRAQLDPIATCRDELVRALGHAQRNKLPPPTLYTIRGCIRDLDIIWENMNDIAEAIDPTDKKRKP